MPKLTAEYHPLWSLRRPVAGGSSWQSSRLRATVLLPIRSLQFTWCIDESLGEYACRRSHGSESLACCNVTIAKRLILLRSINYACLTGSATGSKVSTCPNTRQGASVFTYGGLRDSVSPGCHRWLQAPTIHSDSPPHRKIIRETLSRSLSYADGGAAGMSAGTSTHSVSIAVLSAWKALHVAT